MRNADSNYHGICGERPCGWGKKIFIWACPLPQLVFWPLWFYVETFEGWGAWAAGPMLIPPIILSFFMLIIGAGLIVHSRKSNESAVGLTIATLIASSLAIFFLVKGAFMELARSF